MLGRVAQGTNVLRIRDRFHTGKRAAFVARPGGSHDRGMRRRSIRWRQRGDQSRRAVRRLRSQWSTPAGVSDPQLAAPELAAVQDRVDRLANLPVIGSWK